jgi:hypothetical protein
MAPEQRIKNKERQAGNLRQTQAKLASGLERNLTSQVIMQLKIVSLNFCLELTKKDLIKSLILEDIIEKLFLQETDIKINFDHNLLSFPCFNYETKTSCIYSKVGCYINSSLSYVRRVDLDIKGTCSINIKKHL